MNLELGWLGAGTKGDNSGLLYLHVYENLGYVSRHRGGFILIFYIS